MRNFQNYAPAELVGMRARITPEYGSRNFYGTVTRVTKEYFAVKVGERETLYSLRNGARRGDGDAWRQQKADVITEEQYQEEIGIALKQRRRVRIIAAVRSFMESPAGASDEQLEAIYKVIGEPPLES